MTPCSWPSRKSAWPWTTWPSLVRRNRKRLSLSVALLAWRLITLPFYYHHDLAVLIPSIRCFCFPPYVPYGYLWYFLNWPLSFSYPLGLAIVDFIVSLFIINRSVLWPYLLCSYIIYGSAPYDLSIMWLSLTGPLSGLLLALAAKLPDTLAAWRFVIQKPTDANDVEYYLITAFPWLWLTISNKSHRQKRVKTSF